MEKQVVQIGMPQGLWQALVDGMMEPDKIPVCPKCGQKLILEQSDRRVRLWCTCSGQPPYFEVVLPSIETMAHYVLRRALMLAKGRPTCRTCQWRPDWNIARTDKCPNDPGQRPYRGSGSKCCPHHQDAYLWRPAESSSEAEVEPNETYGPGAEPWEE